MPDEARDGPPIVFISPDSIASASLGGMWNQVLRNKQESSVREAMQILEPNLEDIVFQAGEIMYRSPAGRSVVLVSFNDQPRRVPLGSMGDGMRRLLALSISLSHTSDGILIIDEIDTGLHYSAMANMWKLVLTTAIASNIQVFATTHSLDCVRGLCIVCDGHPDLREKVAVQKIERGFEQSVAYTGADVINAAELDIEIR